MQPNDELNEFELDSLLEQWKVPDAPASLRTAVLGTKRRSWWAQAWSGSIRVPVPLAAILLAMVALSLWAVGGRVEVHEAPEPAVSRTEQVQVPRIVERVVVKVVYRDRLATRPEPIINNLHPVSELRPRIIKQQIREER